MIGWKRKWCTVNREFCEDGEVVRWRAIGHRERTFAIADLYLRINCYTEVRYSVRISYILSIEIILKPVVIVMGLTIANCDYTTLFTGYYTPNL